MINKSIITALVISSTFILPLTCIGGSFKTSLDKKKDTSIHKLNASEKKAPEQKIRQESIRLAIDLKRLKTFAGELESMKSEMYKMRENSNVWTIDYFPPEEHDKIENILFRYLMIRNSLWQMINYYKDYRTRFTCPETQTKGFIIGYSAGLHLTSNTSLLVATFIDEPAGKSKLNEAYPRSGIKSGTFDILLSSVTSLDHMEAIKVGRVLFNKEKKDDSSTLYKIYVTNPEYKTVIDQIDDLYNLTEERIKYILKKESLLFPETINRLRHSVIVKIAEKMSDTLGDNLYAIRGLLFSNVSDIKIPLTKPIKFSEEQKRQIHSMLRPGDIILTYTAGYMSNIFLPGSFKHGITYVGTNAERKETGLVNDPTELIAGINIEKLEKDFSTDIIESGLPADVIEAVAEGVIFNSLDLLLDTHINRMVVLRPKLSLREQKEALTIVFALLGNEYDFKFDFNDGSYQCCTEVIYRALNSRGIYNFDLIKRMGTLTLSADDILEYYVKQEYKPFEIVLYARKDRFKRGNRAKIYTGDEGLRLLKKLMRVKLR
ncbi:MAG: YiiX/YebB-like N1pC/P60 family cysteine hydrolase [Desulfobacteraceae bacterium]|jgi:hypothetical protein